MTPKNKTRNLNFKKMHGLGNDFVIFDGRKNPITFSKMEVRQIADRRTGIGCDQLIILQDSENSDAFLHIQNSDGSLAESCGNATRCVAKVIMSKQDSQVAEIDSIGGLLHCFINGEDVSADMGEPHFGWKEIPLAENRDTLNLGLRVGNLENPVAVNVGNPHVVFFVDDVDKIDIASLGPVIEKYPLFPERVNVNVAQIIDENNIRLKVWERGAGITRACGTGACATLLAASKRGLSKKEASIHLDGGTLKIEWNKDNRIIMTGPAALSFEGEVDLDKLLNKENPA